jgi:site-specific DNA recombinase
VNEPEAERVRAIFTLYRDHRALVPVVQELARRGWDQKCWRTRQGRLRGGQPFTTTSLKRLLTNVSYRGQVRYQNEIHPGEHPALIDETLWQQVQALLASSGHGRGPWSGNPHGSFLHGILRCLPCGCAMVPTSSSKGTRCYRYYVCTSAQKHGWQTCPAPSVSAGTIEQLVLEQLQRLDPDGFAALRPSAGEQTRLIQRLLERVDYDRVGGKLALTLQADHATILAEAQAHAAKETKP